MSKAEIKSSYGVWCLETADPFEQLKRVVVMSKLPKLKTRHARVGKIATFSEAGVQLEDCKSRKNEIVLLDSFK